MSPALRRMALLALAIAAAAGAWVLGADRLGETASRADGEGIRVAERSSIARAGSPESGPATALVPTERFPFAASQVGVRPPAPPTAAEEPKTPLEATVLKVRFVTPDGEPLLTAIRKATATLPSRRRLIAVATPEAPEGGISPLQRAGRYRTALAVGQELRPPPPGFDGFLELDRPLPLHVSAVYGTVVISTQLVPPGEDRVTLVVPLESLRGALGTVTLRVVDAATGDPVSKAFATPFDGVETGAPVAATADGSLSIAGQAPGPLALRVDAVGYEPALVETQARPGEAVDLGAVRLEEGVSVVGEVLGADGKPVASKVLCVPLDRADSYSAAALRTSVPVAADGSFQAFSVPRGRLVVTARAQGLGSAATVVDTTRGSVSGVKLILRGGTTVTFLPQRATADRRLLTIADERGVPVWSQVLEGPWPVPVELSPGAYTLEVKDEAGEVRVRHGFTVGDAGLTIPFVP
jgi:hypothetical protein